MDGPGISVDGLGDRWTAVDALTLHSPGTESHSEPGSRRWPAVKQQWTRKTRPRSDTIYSRRWLMDGRISTAELIRRDGRGGCELCNVNTAECFNFLNGNI